MAPHDRSLSAKSAPASEPFEERPDPFHELLPSDPGFTVRTAPSPIARLAALKNKGVLTVRDAWDLRSTSVGALTDEIDDRAENVIGIAGVPMGVATDFVINGRSRHVVMATEERHVIAAALHAAKLTTKGFAVTYPNGERSLVQAHALFPHPHDDIDVEGFDALYARMTEEAEAITDEAKLRSGRLCVRSFELSKEEFGLGPTKLSITLDCDEIMGANAATRVAERLARAVEPILGRPLAAIVSNAYSGMHVIAEARWDSAAFSDAETPSRIMMMQEWASNDDARNRTHCKGVMNGVSAVALATGQDVRAVEAAAYAFENGDHAFDSRFCVDRRSKTRYRLSRQGSLLGSIELMLPIAVKGGATNLPHARMARKIMGTTTVADLAGIMACAGLATNLSALRCLVEEGITAAHGTAR